jgi:hypothetical protein
MVPPLSQLQYEPELLLAKTLAERLLQTPFVTRHRGPKQLQAGTMDLAISPRFFCIESGV